MANESKYWLNASHPIADDRKILLLDANPASRESRAKALRDRGAHVDCAAAAEDARTAWKPGSHEIVLIEFRNAGEEIRDFYRFARVNGRKQKFGFYLAESPYMTSSHRQCEVAVDCARGPLSVPRKPECEDDNCQTGLREAARRIATVRRLTRPGASSAEKQLRGIPASEAMRIASRVLAGGS